MIDGPGDESSGRGRYGYLRASHADREAVVDLLKTAFVQGRLAKDEFDLRIGRVLASRTYAELNHLTANLPPGPSTVPVPEPAWKSGNELPWESAESKAVRVFACLLVAAPSTVFGVALMEAQSRPELGVAARVFLTLMLACILTVPATGLVLLRGWLEKRSGEEPAQARPSPGQRMNATRFSAADPRS